MNMNTIMGVDNLPQMTVSDTNEHALTVPTLASPPSGVTWAASYVQGTSGFPSAGSNPYPGFPSPQFPVNSGLSVSIPPDLVGSLGVDAHPFKVKIAGVLANPGAGNVTVKLYQVPFANLGTISATGSVTSAGAPGSGDQSINSQAFTTPANPSHFFLEYVLYWDSKNNRLDGYVSGMVMNTLVGQAAVTALTSGVAAVNQLNFLPSFTFATGNGANAVTVSEFAVERY